MTKRSLLKSLLALFAVGGARPATASPTPAPTRPTLTPEQAALLRNVEAWQARHALPAMTLEPAGPATHDHPGGNRLGGRVWLPEGESWPTGSDGKPLGFLAQIDFATFPALPDFPGEGLLQFFIGRDDLYGADFDHPEKGNFKVIYRETATGAGSFREGPGGEEHIDDYSPVYGATARDGILLSPGERSSHQPSVEAFLFHRDFATEFDDRANDVVYDELADRGMPSVIQVGGHPGYTQSDWREGERYNNVDRVLLEMWSLDPHLMWGDSGQGQFMIRRDDLLKRDFSTVFYQWDCY